MSARARRSTSHLAPAPAVRDKLMRVKRARKVRKYLRYYRTCHGFRAPYKVRTRGEGATKIYKCRTHQIVAAGNECRRLVFCFGCAARGLWGFSPVAARVSLCMTQGTSSLAFPTQRRANQVVASTHPLHHHHHTQLANLYMRS